MKTMRMPKGWVLVGTNAFEFGKVRNRTEQLGKDHAFRMAIKNAKPLVIPEKKAAK